MGCELQVSANDKRQSILPFPLVCGSHLDRGQREYNRGEPRRKAVGLSPAAFSFARTQTLPVKFRVLFVIPPLPDHTCQQGKHFIVKSLRGLPAYYRNATGRGKSAFNRHSMGDWERALFTDSRALGKPRPHLNPKKGRGVAVARDRQTEQRELFRLPCERCKKRDRYWSASWCEECIWEFVNDLGNDYDVWSI